ncbi:PREDICTED: ribosomal lysine N-methyltransferase 3 [Tarenaya hassleriana]|uniref:ribosomal lysine N-methyltransferase 3 n=1 Tax=Tarenaya hassleriana TaxID=28532 RepID=UPI00053C7144|nr:PREDICTED: ribosomal lysine N-methyltransferase 3 [Tarenaya hassleriana]
MDTTRRLRAFKRWMRAHGVECSDALRLVDDPQDGVSVRTLCDLKEGDVVANIPKKACLTMKTSGAREIIEAAGLDGYLGLSVALMYERSLGEQSPWSGYLQLLPLQEDLPLVWSLHDLDSLLLGTELHKVVKEDKALIYEDWKESILPLTHSSPQIVDPKFFGVEEYIAAKSLIASRSFEIDDYHGFGMVPLADLFNHKTGAEDVHFTSDSSHGESGSEADENNEALEENRSEDEASTQTSSEAEQAFNQVPAENNDDGADEDSYLVVENDHPVLEMIMVKDVLTGAEVFNTYGTLGNAALLHRYGFTETDNPYDIINIDMELVLGWSSSSFSGRYTRARLALWRRLGYTPCESQNSEYFEITSNGEPQTELLVLLYILLLPDNTYNKLDLAVSTACDENGFFHVMSPGNHKITFGQTSSDIENDVFLTEDVRGALISVADKRESLYGTSSLEDDIAALKECCLPRDRRLLHSLTLRVSERRILEKLRRYARLRVDGICEGKRRKKRLNLNASP